jgi:hypothetical protein
MKIEFTSHVFKEGKMFVAHTPELDISSCATTKGKALANLQEAVRLFLEEAGFSRRNRTLVGPKLVDSRRVTIPLPLVHVQS